MSVHKNTGDPEARVADPTRRKALARLGGYAMCVAPAMLVLTSGHAGAQGRGNGGGDGGGNGNPQAPCDNPAWDLGLKRAGHSGC
jgi:hypothetical protein